MINRFRAYVDSFIPKDRAAGIDGAHWWGWFKPELATKPIDFIVIKATQDDRWIDPAFHENWIGASKIDMRGAYHYQKLFISWRSQADHFLRQAGKYDFHIYALDVEKIGNETAFINREHGDMFVSDMRRIIDYWRQQAPGKSVWLYTNRDIYQTLIYPTVKRLYGAEGLQWLASLPLWLAVYNGLGPHGEPSMPTGRETWQVWQYSDTGKPADYGTNGAVDLNVYNGTKAEMLTWLGITEPPSPEPGEPMPETIKEGTVSRVKLGTSTTLQIRNGAGQSFADIGDLHAGDRVFGVIVSAVWLEFNKIIRANGAVELWPVHGFASTQYMDVRDVPVEPPTTPAPVLPAYFTAYDRDGNALGRYDKV